MNPRALSYRQREPCWVIIGRVMSGGTEKPIPWWAWLIALWLVLALIRKLLT